MTWESKSAVVRSSSSTSEKPLNSIHSLLFSWPARTVTTAEDSGLSSSESEDSEEEISSVSFEDDTASKI